MKSTDTRSVKKVTTGGGGQSLASNVRQLENVCRWITVMASGDRVDIDELPPEISQAETTVSNLSQEGDWWAGLQLELKRSFQQGHGGSFSELMDHIEQLAMNEALNATAGHKQKAAELLGWGRNTLTRKLKKS